MINWISVDERLPDNTRNVLLYTRLGYRLRNVTVGFYESIGNNFCDTQRGHIDKVTHWAEINEPESK